MAVGRSSRPQPALGRAIRELRMERGFSQEAVALEAGMEPSWISHIERGRRNPAWSTIKRIADAIELPVSEIARRAEQIEAAANQQRQARGRHRGPAEGPGRG